MICMQYHHHGFWAAGLFTALALSTCLSSPLQSAEPPPLDSQTLNILSVFGLNQDIIHDPVINAIRTSNKRAFAKLLEKDEISDYPYGGLGAMQMSALFGKSDIIKVLLDRGVSADDRLNEKLPTPLHLAVMSGELAAAKLFLESGANPRLSIGKGMSTIPLAATYGQTAVLEWLRRRDFAMDESYMGNLTPLSLAAKEGHVATAQWLLDQGANVNAQDLQGMTPLHHAAIGNHDEVVRLLLSRGADQRLLNKRDMTPLMAAVQSKNMAAISALAEQAEYLNVTNQAGLSATWISVHRNQRETLRLLAENKADLTIRDAQQQTLMHMAVRSNAFDVLEWLVESTNDMNARDIEGYTPLARAIFMHKINAADFLIDHGADVNIVINTGFSPLMLAVSAGNNTLVRKLLAAGANINDMLPNGQTPVLLAASNGDRQTLRMLFEAGASGDDHTERGYNIFDFALSGSKISNLKFLLQQGLDPMKIYKKYRWPVALNAAWQGNSEFVTILLDHGVDPNTADMTGQSIMVIALRRGHTNIVHSLLKRGADPAQRDSRGATAWHNAYDRKMYVLANDMASRMTEEQCMPTNRIRVYFDLDAPLATNVSVAGTFNEWNSSEYPLQRREDDSWWYTEVEVFPFFYKYKLIVDNNWILDPNNENTYHDQQADIYDSIFIATERTPDKRPARAASRADLLKEVVFTYQSDKAVSVSVAGEFNGWNSRSLPMVRDEKGLWKATKVMSPGEYGYKFVVDDKWILDPSNQSIKTVNDVRNSLIVVSP